MPVERHTFKEWRLQCECGWQGKKLGWDFDGLTCDACGKTADHYVPSIGLAPGIVPDDLPGGYAVHHGLCNADGSPRKFYSKTEIRAEAARRGLMLADETPGGKHSGESRWY